MILTQKGILSIFHKAAIYILIAGILLISLPWNVDAQSSAEDWNEHLNLSQSGGATNPQIIMDSEGNFHVFWEDLFAGYVYTYSNDGIEWSQPLGLNWPFSTALRLDTLSGSPVFFPDNNGHIHVFWTENTDLFDNVLFHSRIEANSLPVGESWENTQRLGSSVIDLDIDIDSEGVLHLAYQVTGDENQGTAGIYYIHTLDNQYFWTAPVNLYQSQYFRTLDEISSNIDVATSINDGIEGVFITWDNRPLERIFLIKSDDGGQTWNDIIEIDQPDERNPSEIPFNIQVANSGSEVLLLWQVGQPDGACKQYYQGSSDQGTTWDEPESMLSDFSGCPLENAILLTDIELILLLTMTQNQSYMLAWDGDRWSEAQPQLSLSNFVDPETYNQLNLGCQHTIIEGDQVFTIGCDSPEGGDIWLTNRSIGDAANWFPPPPVWSPSTIISINETGPISPVAISDSDGRIHVFWSQIGENGQFSFPTEIMYAGWADERWSSATAVIVSQEGIADFPAVTTDNTGRLLLTWSGGESGDIFFSWASAIQAMSTLEWTNPLVLPALRQGGSKPDILVDLAGTYHVVYAIPLNEARGLYLTSSTDRGDTWADPIRIFDAADAEWDMLDNVKLAQTKNGDMHVLWTRYTLPGGIGSLALYYSRSSDGGQSWSEPENVVENTISWSDINRGENNSIHRFWVERSSGRSSLFHQISLDSGITWENPTNISTLNSELISVSTTVDPTGKIHLVQFVKEFSGNHIIQHWIWQNQSWSPLEGLILGDDFTPGSGSLGTTITSDRILGILYSGITLSEKTKNLENNLFFNNRSIELAEAEEVFITPSPTPELSPTPLSTKAQHSITSTPTITPIFQPINQIESDSQMVINRPWAGLVIGSILGAIVLAIVIGLFFYRRWKK